MNFTLKKIPLNWYRWDVWFSFRLLHSYVQGVEKQIDVSIGEYQTESEKQIATMLEYGDEETGWPDIVETHGGLDSDDWDLQDIFVRHFPSLQRRGALITLYSFLENELNKLCELYRRHQTLKISFTEMHGKGVERAMLFLEGIVGLEIDKTGAWRDVKKIGEVRNVIVHANGKLKDRVGKNKELAKYVEDSAYLSGAEEIIIEKGYLEYVLETFENQIREIDKAIRLASGSS